MPSHAVMVSRVRRITVVVIAILLTFGFLAIRSPSASAAETEGYKNVATNRCVDHSITYGLRALSCNGTYFQAWRAGNCDGAYCEIVNVQTGLAIDDSFTYGLRAIARNGLNYQKWARVIYSNGVEFVNLNTGRAIDDSFTYGLRSFSRNGSNHQKFIVDNYI